LKWHPEKNEGKKRELADDKFREICEAYEVLSDALRRARFDQYGEVGLKQGVPNGRGGTTAGWSLSKHPEAIFADFFGASSPFAEFGAESGSLSVARTAAMEKQLALEQNLYCSLEELYGGCHKKSRVARRRLQSSTNGSAAPAANAAVAAAAGSSNGDSSFTEDVVINVDISPGWRSGTRITFQGEGHEAAGMQTSDLVLTLLEKPHPRFARRHDDLVYRATVSLLSALTGCTVQVLTLDQRTLPIAINQIISPGYVHVVENEGMPLPREPTRRGNLLIEFTITFPETLTPSQKVALSRVLPA